MDKMKNLAIGNPESIPNLPDFPPRVLIDFATDCNLRCPQCLIWNENNGIKSEKVKGIMPEQYALTILEQLYEPRPMVHPSLWAEPLIVPNFTKYVSLIKSKGLKVAMNTNGIALTDELAKFFVEVQLDAIMFSIDAVTPSTLMKVRGINKISVLERAVTKMLTARGNKIYPRIGVSFTVQKANEGELDAFVARWLGKVDVIRISHQFENGHFYNLTSPKNRTPCPALYKTMPIHSDGTVSICCLDGFRTTNVGNAFNENLSDIWNGEKFNAARKLHEAGRWDEIAICSSCNGWSQESYTEEIKDGHLIRRSPLYTYYNKLSALDNAEWS